MSAAIAHPASRAAPRAYESDTRCQRGLRVLLRLAALAGALLVLAIELAPTSPAGDALVPTSTAAARAPAVRFFMVICLSACLATAVYGVGAQRGAVGGLVAGMTCSMLMAERSGAPSENQLAFIVLGSTIFAALGYLAGGMRGRTGDADTTTPSAGNAAAPDRGARLLKALPARCAALRKAANATPRAVWLAFDQHARDLLREHFGAAGVRVLRVTRRDGAIRPLHATSAANEPDSDLRAALQRALEHGAPLRFGSPPGDDPSDARGSWLLPLGTPPSACVVVRALRDPTATPRALTTARDALECLWQTAQREAALRRARRRDAQTRVLDRTCGLRRLDGALAAARWRHEPLAVLVIALDGLRRLDDVRAWTLRDRLVTRAGATLRERTRRGDATGRLADDRFVVILRRADAALAERLAAPLVESLRTELDLAQDEGGTPLAVRVHAGLALHDADASRFAAERSPALHERDELLGRALGLVLVARARRRDLVSDADPTARRPRDAAQFGGALDARERDATDLGRARGVSLEAANL